MPAFHQDRIMVDTHSLREMNPNFNTSEGAA